MSEKPEVIHHPETGEELTRNVFSREITYNGLSKTVDMPGWYTKDGSNAIFTKEDLKVFDQAMKELKGKGKE